MEFLVKQLIRYADLDYLPKEKMLKLELMLEENLPKLATLGRIWMIELNNDWQTVRDKLGSLVLIGVGSCPQEIAAFYGEGGEGTKAVAALLKKEIDAFLETLIKKQRELPAEYSAFSTGLNNQLQNIFNYYRRGLDYANKIIQGALHACGERNPKKPFS